MFADDLGQQKRGNRGDDEGYGRQTEWMGEGGAVATLAAREVPEELGDSGAEIHGKRKNGAELDDDGVHLPVAVAEVDVKQGFAETQMGRRAYGQKFGESFDDAEQDGQQVVVQSVSPGSDLVFLTAECTCLALFCTAFASECTVFAPECGLFPAADSDFAGVESILRIS